MHSSELVTQICELVLPVQNKLLNAAYKVFFDGHQLDAAATLELEDVNAFLDYIGLYIKIIGNYVATDPKEFRKKMVILGYSEQFVDNCVSRLSQMPLDRSVEFDKLTYFKWRLDISFFDSKPLGKIPVPIIISIKTSTGKKLTIEVSGKSFHKLRYIVALLIKDLLAVKKLHNLKV